MKHHTFNDLPIQFPLKKMNIRYLEKIEDVLGSALDNCPRLFAVRIDLRQPYYERDDLRRDEIYGLARNGNNLIRRFLDSLGQQ
jgi:hypothetical protein